RKTLHAPRPIAQIRFAGPFHSEPSVRVTRNRGSASPESAGPAPSAPSVRVTRNHRSARSEPLLSPSSPPPLPRPPAPSPSSPIAARGPLRPPGHGQFAAPPAFHRAAPGVLPARAPPRRYDYCAPPGEGRVAALGSTHSA